MNPNSRLSRYRSRAVEQLKHAEYPAGHDTYSWVSQDGKVTPIQDLDDRHLINIYRILKKSDDYLSNLAWDTETYDLFCENTSRLNHVDYEVSLRGLIIPKFELYKTIPVKTVFQLLQMGCQIQFPNGYVLKGDPETGYIETKMIIGDELLDDGLRNLTEEGTVDAINDAMTFTMEDVEP
jgi:hypothetical protein